VRPWGQFWRLLSQLGADSRYSKAQVDDPELAEMLAEEEAAKRKEAARRGETIEDKWAPQPADFTLMHELVAEVRDLLADVVVITGRGLPSNGTRKFAARFPRPQTELTKARLRVTEREDVEYMDQMDSAIMAAKQRWRDQQAAQAAEISEAVTSDALRD
jgi:hypothetical protein